MYEVVVGIYIAIPVVIFGAGALIWVRDRWFPKRRRRLRNVPGDSSGPVGSSEPFYYLGARDGDGNWGSGGDSGGDGGGDGGGGSS